MSCDPIIIDAGCRPVTLQVRDDTTTLTISHKRKPRRLPMLIWVLGPIREQNLGPREAVVHMTTLTDTQQVSGTVSVVDKAGQPSTVQDGSSQFVADNDAIEVVVDPANPLSVTVKAKKVGAAKVTWSGDADLGDGVVTITASEDFTVTGGQAVGAGFAFGPPVEQA